MKKAFLLFLFFCISNFLFSQTEKGTHFLGTSHLSLYNSYQTNFFQDSRISDRSLGLQYGRFIKDKVLVGANLKYAPEVHQVGAFVTNGMALSLNPFFRRYFGKKRIKPFAEAGIRLTLIKGNLLYQAEIRPGLAFFLTKNTSLDLSFNFSLLNNNRFLPDNLVPQIGLSLHFFLQYDKENKTEIKARDKIKKGLLSADFSGQYMGFETTNLRANVGLKYFFLDNIYLSSGLNTIFQKSPNFSIARSALIPRVGIGAYYHLGNFTAFTVQASGQKRSYNINRFASGEKNTSVLKAETKAGLALFLGKQRFEFLAGIEYSKYKSSDSTQTLSDNNFVLTLGHEYFIFNNVSINSSLSAFPESQKQHLYVNNQFRFDNIYDKRYDLYLNVRLQWYIGL